MGHFNVIKGQYPSLSQLEETLAVKAAETDIVRGSVLVKDAGTFRLGHTADAGSASSSGPIVYFALQAQTDPDVVMAKKITGIPCTAPIRVETDQYNTSTISAANVGQFLRVEDTGILGLAADGNTACGIITSAPTYHWSNNAGPSAGFPSPRTGGRISVITFWCVYVPEVVI